MSDAEFVASFSDKHAINGDLLHGEGATQSIYNPATGEVIAEVAETSLAQVNMAVNAASQAFTRWYRQHI
jgi:aminobutyraldehyde dehydrogenase